MTHRWITAIVVALMTTAAAGPALAAPGAATETNVDENRFETSANRSIQGDQIQASFSFDTRSANLTAAYSFEANDTNEITNHSFELQLHQLVEYEDVNDNGHYDENDTVVSSYRLSQNAETPAGEENGTVEWRALNETTIEANGTEGKLVTARAEFPGSSPKERVNQLLMQDTNRTFGLDFAIFPEKVTYEDRRLGPTTIGTDIHVTNYPYAKDGTQLALIGEANATTELTETADPTGVEATSEIEELAEIGLGFAWSAQATVDNSTEPVESTVRSPDSGNETTADESTALVALNYARGDEITHEAQLDADVRPMGSGALDDLSDKATGVPAPSAIATLGVISALAIAVRRKA